MVAMATKRHFEHCRTWSQLKAQQSLLLNSTISTTSWNYIFLEQDGFEVVIWCVGWCVKKNESSKVCFDKCKSILPKIQSIECRSFFIYMLLPTSCASKWYQWLRIWLSRNIRFVSVNVGLSARNRNFQTSYWCITIWPSAPSWIRATRYVVYRHFKTSEFRRDRNTKYAIGTRRPIHSYAM